LLVGLVEVAVGLLGQVEVAPGLAADHDRDDEEIAHRRVTRREPEGAGVLGDVTTFPAKPLNPVLRATLWTGEKPQYLYGKLVGGFADRGVRGIMARSRALG
jgi:hypothetical protein